MPISDASGTLMNLAEIAAAFAGFAALVSVLRERGDRVEAAHNILRLRIVISTSVVVVGASLIPIALSGFGLDESLIWRICAVILLIFNYGVILSFVRSYQPVQGSFPPDRLAVSLVGTLELLDQIALALVILSVWPELNYSLYFAALVFNLCQAAFVFVRFIGSEFTVGGA